MGVIMSQVVEYGLGGIHRKIAKSHYGKRWFMRWTSEKQENLTGRQSLGGGYVRD